MSERGTNWGTEERKRMPVPASVEQRELAFEKNWRGMMAPSPSTSGAEGPREGGGNGGGGVGGGGGSGGAVAAAMAKKTERWWIERGKTAATLVEDGGAGQGENGRVADARVLHTPLHLLVNRINQRHHGLSPIPLRLRASTLTSSPILSPSAVSPAAVSPSPRLSCSCSCSFLTFFLSLSPYPPSPPPPQTPSRSIANGAHRHSLTAPFAQCGAR